MDSNNSRKFKSSLCNHIANLNHALKGTKSDTIIDFICIDYKGLIITSNKVTFLLDISIINNYVKNCNNININDIQNTCLPQSKSYLKILDIRYLIEGTNTPINSEVMKLIIKSTHIFDNIKIASKPWVVKISLKSDMAIV